MPVEKEVSKAVIRRLPRYYRFLGELLKTGTERISSRELAEKMGLTASQIRQDLNCFGGFGQQGYGYNIEQLHREIASILGLDASLKTIVIGAGNLGRAIATHMEFDKRGFSLIGIFDNKEAICGQLVRGLPVRHIDSLDDFCRELRPQIAVLCVPKDAAKDLADQLISLGIKGIWNFSHYDLSVIHPEIPIENVHLSDSMMTLCYRVTSNYSQTKTPNAD